MSAILSRAGKESVDSPGPKRPPPHDKKTADDDEDEYHGTVAWDGTSWPEWEEEQAPPVRRLPSLETPAPAAPERKSEEAVQLINHWYNRARQSGVVVCAEPMGVKKKPWWGGAEQKTLVVRCFGWSSDTHSQQVIADSLLSPEAPFDSLVVQQTDSVYPWARLFCESTCITSLDFSGNRSLAFSTSLAYLMEELAGTFTSDEPLTLTKSCCLRSLTKSCRLRSLTKSCRLQSLDISFTETDYALANRLIVAIIALIEQNQPTLHELHISGLRFSPKYGAPLVHAVAANHSLYSLGNLYHCWFLDYDEIERINERLLENCMPIYHAALLVRFRSDHVNHLILRFLVHAATKLSISPKERRERRERIEKALETERQRSITAKKIEDLGPELEAKIRKWREMNQMDRANRLSASTDTELQVAMALSASMQSPSEWEQLPWECPACTFHNPSSAPCCLMCRQEQS